jgi:hypothetical protein
MGTEGIVSMMSKVNVVDAKMPTKEEFVKILEDIEKKSRKEAIKREKYIKNNLKQLNKRSKELNEPIPTLLGLMIASSYPLYVGSDFFQKYKKWLK